MKRKMTGKISEDFLVKNNFSVRPFTNTGLWVFFLLPISLIISSIRHPIIITPTYKLASLVSLTLLCNSIYIVATYFKNQRLKILNVWSIAIALSTGCLFNLCLHKGWTFSVTSGFLISVIFLKTYIFLLSDIRESFTLGEAGLLSQGMTLFLYCAGNNILNFEGKRILKSYIQISTIIIQVGLLGIIVLAYIVQKAKIRSTKSFYLTTSAVLIFAVLIPLHVILRQSPLLWIFSQIFGDILLLKLFIYWSFCIAVAILAVSNQIYYAKKASTGTRKIFHILAVLIYIPGLYYRCYFLFLASGVILGIFFALEILRLLSIPPLGSHLQDGYIVFRDEKDTGPMALTAIYLLAGVSIPLWLHPSPCDVTDSAQFALLPLLGGLLSIGVGDTAASFVGSNFGRLKWKASNKTVEGTIACIFSQLAFFYFLFYLGVLPYLNTEQVIRMVFSVVVGSLVEAKTSQIDNLVLPFIMYIILI